MKMNLGPISTCLIRRFRKSSIRSASHSSFTAHRVAIPSILGHLYLSLGSPRLRDSGLMLATHLPHLMSGAKEWASSLKITQFSRRKCSNLSTDQNLKGLTKTLDPLRDFNLHLLDRKRPLIPKALQSAITMSDRRRTVSFHPRIA